MSSDTYDSFKIDYEIDSISSDDLIMGNKVRSRIRIFVDSICLTDPNGEYTVGDFLPHNCTKLLRGIEPLVNDRPHRVPFTDTVCDLQFEPVGEDTILVNAYRADGAPRNPNVPRDGVNVKKGSVIDEIVRSSRSVQSRFEEINSVESDENYQEFINLLSDIQNVRDPY